jgi:radical SAM superfamily enzyme YgiQ (UPF0313 family)
MRREIALLNPNLVVQRSDPFTTGIVYMPIALAYLAASLRAAGLEPRVVDAFGEAPRRARLRGKFMVLGLDAAEAAGQLPHDAVVFVYAINLTSHLATMELIKAVRAFAPYATVVAFENTQAVTAYSLRHVANEFFAAGADYILAGGNETIATRLATALRDGEDEASYAQLPGLGSPRFFNPTVVTMPDLDQLPFPAWDLFPIENYWALRFAHGPQTAARYLPLQTSRGCPYPCRFCVVPSTNNQRWRGRAATCVVDEIAAHVAAFGVHEFHIEDLDPTISEGRIRGICEEILRRGLRVTWKIVAGTKVETIREEETIDLMARAGCRYISISPETGSPRVLKLMRKPFHVDHAVRIIRRMSRVGIRSQACFVLGFPGETDDDRELTRRLVHSLTREGVDEIALFIATPVPGSAIYGEVEGYTNLSELTFSPSWRSDFRALSSFRLRLYVQFLLWKLRYHPQRILAQPLRFLTRRFETKMEMVPYRAAVLKSLELFAGRSA